MGGGLALGLLPLPKPEMGPVFRLPLFVEVGFFGGSEAHLDMGPLSWLGPPRWEQKTCKFEKRNSFETPNGSTKHSFCLTHGYVRMCFLPM